MRVLVTGVNGFVGHYLAKELHSRGHSVSGAGRDIDASQELAGVLDRYFQCDLAKAIEVDHLELGDLDAVISLAGLARTGDSFKNPGLYKRINVDVASVLGQRLLRDYPKARFVAVSTGAVYAPNQDMPLTEDSETTPEGSPYAESKLLMERAVQDLGRLGLDYVIVRPFNHIGPGQETGFLVPDLYERVAEYLKTGQPAMVGNLKTRRDYTDVRDIVKAYADLAEASAPKYDLYNVCSSRTLSGQQILNKLSSLMDANKSLELKVNPSLIRQNDPPELYGSYRRLHDETGWQPQIDIDKTIQDFVDSKAQS